MNRTSGLSLRLGSIPVRILPSFFLTTVVLNFSLARDEPARLLLWSAIVLGSVLVHELGHALAGRFYGLSPKIDLHGFGGTTSWTAGPPASPGRRIVISIAGPCMGFVAGALVLAFAAVLGPGPGAACRLALATIGLVPSPLDGSTASFTYESLLFVNVGWGLLNLLPMLPLDGGNVMAQVFDLWFGGRGERPTRIVSLAVASAATLAALATVRVWPALLGASFVASNWRGLQDQRSREHDAPMRAALEKAYVALEAKKGQEVMALARPVALSSQTAPVRAEAMQLMAFGFLLEGRLGDAEAAIAGLPAGFQPHPSLLALRDEVAASQPGPT